MRNSLCILRESPPEEIRNSVKCCTREVLAVLIGCDANAQNEVWGSTDNNWRGNELLDFTLKGNLVVLNTRAEPTFVTSTRSKVLDITFCNEWIKSWVHGYRVSHEPSMLDHGMIEATVNSVIPLVVWFRYPRKAD